MTKPTETVDEILTENEHLKTRIEELEEVLKVIRSGEADAILGSRETEGQIYTLNSAETPYRHFVETISEGAVTFSRDGMILYANMGFSAIVHLPPEQIIGSAFSNLVVDSDREAFAAILTTALERPISGELNLKVSSETGTGSGSGPVQLSLSRLSDKDHETVVGIVTDLTFLKRTEEIIRSERLARSILEQAGEAIVVCNSNGEVIRANPVAHRLAGTNPVRQHFSSVFPVVLSGNMAAGLMNRELLGGKTFRGVEAQLENINSVSFDLLVSGSPLMSDTDEILGSVIVLSDITEHKASEERIMYLNRVLQTIRDVNRLLVQEKDPDILLQKVCDIMSESKGFENAWIVRFDNKGAIMRTYESGVVKAVVNLETALQQEKYPWCIEETLQRCGVVSIEDDLETCSECPLSAFCAGRVTQTCLLSYKGEELYGVLSATLPKEMTPGEEDIHLFKEICDDVAFGLHAISLGEREARALVQIQQNLMQLATLNDEIRNPLTVIKALNSMEATEHNRKVIDEQIEIIDDIIRMLDMGWLNSEKIWNYLMKYHGVQNHGIQRPDDGAEGRKSI